MCGACCDQGTSPMPMPVSVPSRPGAGDVDCVDVTFDDYVTYQQPETQPHRHDPDTHAGPACHTECRHVPTPRNDELRHTPVGDTDCPHNTPTLNIDCPHNTPTLNIDCPHNTPTVNIDCPHNTPTVNIDCPHNTSTVNTDCRHTPVQDDDCHHSHTPTLHAHSHFRSTHSPIDGAMSPHPPVRDVTSPITRSVGCCRTPAFDKDLPQPTRSVCTQVCNSPCPSPCPSPRPSPRSSPRPSPRSSPRPSPRVAFRRATSPHTPATPVGNGCSPAHHVACSPMVPSDVTNCHSHPGTPSGGCEHTRSPMRHFHDAPHGTPTCGHAPAHRADYCRTHGRDANQARDVACGQTPTPFGECPQCHGPRACGTCHHAPGYGVTCQHAPCGMHAPPGYVCHCHDHPAMTDRASSAYDGITLDRSRATSRSPRLVATQARSPAFAAPQRATSPLLEQKVSKGTTTVIYDTIDIGTSGKPSTARVDKSTSRSSFKKVDTTTSRIPLDLHRSVSGVPFREADAATSRGSIRRVDTATSRYSPIGRKTIATSRGSSANFRGNVHVDGATSRGFRAVGGGTNRAPSVTFQMLDTAMSRSSDVNNAPSATNAVDMGTHPHNTPVDRGGSNMSGIIKNKIQVCTLPCFCLK